MTDHIRKEANAALSRWMESNPIRLGTEDRWELFIQGYLAALKKLRAEQRLSRKLYKALLTSDEWLSDEDPKWEPKLIVTKALNAFKTSRKRKNS